MNTSPTCAIGIFIKYPQAGKVKTRLAAQIGHEEASQIYRTLLDQNYRKLILPLMPTITPMLFCDPFRPLKDYKAMYSDNSLHYEFQSGEGLGERLTNAFKMLLQKYSKAIIVGSDCPDINPILIKKTCALLEKYDLVVGPSPDGGYYLIAMNHFYPELFLNISWSTHKVLSETKKIADRLKLNYYSLIPLTDIDTIENLKAISCRYPKLALPKNLTY